jgi:CHRD domain
MFRLIRFVALSLAVVLGTPALAKDKKDKDEETFTAKLIGFEEVPAIATAGRATLRMTLSNDGTTLTFELSFEGLTAAPTVAHVHFGQRSVIGGVSFFFCGGGGKPACPASNSGTITGTVVAADVVGPAAQGIAPGDLDTVLQAMRAGVTYANMHTPLHPVGEIRGQVKGDDED